MEREAIRKPKLRQKQTGLPLQMKREAERRTGVSLDDVSVFYGSSRPVRLGALAYAQGNQIYLGPGQERYLAHELSHVVQQKLGLVYPSRRVGGEPLNDDPGLERSADRGEFPRRAARRRGSDPAEVLKPGQAGNASSEGAVSSAVGVVQRTVWKLGGSQWRKFSDLESPGKEPLPKVDAENGIPENGSFFDDRSGMLFPPDSAEYMGRLIRRRHERARRGVYANRVTGIAGSEPKRATPMATPADPEGKFSKLYRFRGQLLISGSGFGERRAVRSSRPVRKGPPAYDDIPERAPFPEGTFSSAARFLIQEPEAQLPPAPAELTQEQQARVAALTLIQGSEEKRVPTGGSLPYAFMMAAEQQGPAAAISQYPFAPKGGTAYTRKLALGQIEFTPEQAEMFLPNMPGSPLLKHEEEEGTLA